MVAHTQVSLPTDQVDQFQREAAAMGLDLAAYLAFLHESHLRKHDVAFGHAAAYTFARYAKTLKKLAE